MQKMWAVLGCLLAGCGAPKSGDSSPDSGAPVAAEWSERAVAIQGEGDLPVCNGASKGALVYIISAKVFNVCDGIGWVEAAVESKPGDAGAPPTRISASITCTGFLQDTTLTFSYSASLMSSGDIFVDGSIASTGWGVSSSRFYSAAQNGAATGSVTLVYDQMPNANAGWWELTLDRNSLVVTIKANDTDLTGGSRTWTMTPDKCVKNTY